MYRSKINSRIKNGRFPANVPGHLFRANALTKQIFEPIQYQENMVKCVYPPLKYPIIWEIGHIEHFYEKHLLNCEYPCFLFDSADNPAKYRHLKTYPSVAFQLQNMDDVTEIAMEMARETDFKHYVSTLCLFHHHEHLENALMMMNALKAPNPLEGTNVFKTVVRDIREYEWVTVSGGDFTQGTTQTFYDCECPPFETELAEFQMSKYPVTQGQFLRFVEDAGYKRQELWSPEGWLWAQTNACKHPISWELGESGTWYRWDFDTRKKLELDFPVCNLSFWEAEAFANYVGARLPTETEMEYVMKNGKESAVNQSNNTNYTGGMRSVYATKGTENAWDIRGLVGNVWQWTSTRFYPYDGFVCDPVNESRSYSQFHSTNVVKGASWATDDMLIYPSSRKAVDRDDRLNFVGVRLVLKQ
jgi:iron(II)-dependent oxidoreductase